MAYSNPHQTIISVWLQERYIPTGATTTTFEDCTGTFYKIDGNSGFETTPDFPLQLSDCLSATLRTGGFAISSTNRKNAIVPYTKCVIDIDGVKSYWLANSKVERTRGGNSPVFKHIVTLCDPLMRLKGYDMANFTFTQPLQKQLLQDNNLWNVNRYTYWSALKRVEALVPFDYCTNTTTLTPTTETRAFSLDATLETKLNGVELPETFPASKNLAEFLEAIGKNLGAEPKIQKGFDIVTFVFLDDLKTQIGNIDGDAYSNNHDETQYCTQIACNIENAVMENADGSSVCFPYVGGYCAPSAPDGSVRMTTENAIIKLPYKIKSIDKLIIKNAFVGYLSQNYGADVDLTDSLITQQEYALIKKTNTNYRSTCRYIRYSLGDNKILLEMPAGDFPILNPKTNYNNALYNALNYWAINNVEGFVLGTTGKIGFPVEDNYDIRECEFQIWYTAEADSIKAKSVKEPSAEFTADFCAITNQDEAIVSTENLGRVMHNTVERIGRSTEKHIKYYVEDAGGLHPIAQIPKVGSVDSRGYVITNINLKIAPLFVCAEIITSKNYSQQSAMVGINSQPRIYEIPNDGFVTKRNEHYQEFCTFSFTQRSNDSLCGFSKTTNYSIAHLLTTLRPNKGVFVIDETLVLKDIIRPAIMPDPSEAYLNTIVITYNSAGFNTYWQCILSGEEYIWTFASTEPINAYKPASTLVEATSTTSKLLLSLSACSFGNSLLFSTTFTDNYSAGRRWKTVTDESDAIIEVPYVEKLTVGNETISLGKRNLIELAFGNASQTGHTISRALPEYVGTFDTSISFPKPFLLLKDARETIGFSYQLHCVADNPKIVVGKAFFSNNAFLKNILGTPQLRLYLLNTPVGKIDNWKVPSDSWKIPILGEPGYGLTATKGDFEIDIEERSITLDSEAWANIEHRNSSALYADVSGWAIGDEEGNLYLACNTLLNGCKTIYLNFGRTGLYQN